MLLLLHALHSLTCSPHTTTPQLNHPNIVRLIAFYDEPETFYIVTELMTGGELFDQIVEKVRSSLPRPHAVVSQWR